MRFLQTLPLGEKSQEVTLFSFKKAFDMVASRQYIDAHDDMDYDLRF